jgi:hypothetical protein
MTVKVAVEDWDGSMLEPSPIVHQVWQQHVLDTKSYLQHCARITTVTSRRKEALSQSDGGGDDGGGAQNSAIHFLHYNVDDEGEDEYESESESNATGIANIVVTTGSTQTRALKSAKQNSTIISLRTKFGKDAIDPVIWDMTLSPSLASYSIRNTGISSTSSDVPVPSRKRMNPSKSAPPIITRQEQVHVQRGPQEGCLVINNNNNNSQIMVGTTSTSLEENGIMYLYDSKTWCVPEHFEFPTKPNLYDAWVLWLKGMPDYERIEKNAENGLFVTMRSTPVRPFRSIQPNKLPKRLGNKFKLEWRPVLQMMEGAPGMVNWNEMDPKVVRDMMDDGTTLKRYYELGLDHVKTKASYIWQLPKCHRMRNGPVEDWCLSTWSRHIQYSNILKNGTEADKKALGAPTKFNRTHSVTRKKRRKGDELQTTNLKAD